ncbi:MAG: hypothetical protein ABL907_24425 [Hyphomicrobium sp.]
MKLLRSAVTLAATVFLAGGAAAQNGPRTFTFIGWGDVPYAIPGDYAKVDRLIAAMNAVKPVFSIHVGDIKAGNTPCSDEVFGRALGQIQTVEHPVVYSIGDNEWTDCHRADNGKFDPRERLARVRQMFFPKPGQSLGRAPMAVESQALKEPKFSKFVENQRFVRNGVMFVVPHIVGSNNGFEPIDPKAAEEFFERDAANLAWIKDSFAQATASGASALVIAFQANLYDTRRSAGTSIPVTSGFHATIREITAGARAFAKPVLVMHGDQHTLELDMFRDVQLRTVPNVLRLQLWGEGKVHGMRVIVDPDMPGVFSFAPLIVPENGAF